MPDLHNPEELSAASRAFMRAVVDSFGDVEMSGEEIIGRGVSCLYELVSQASDVIFDAKNAEHN